MRPDPPPAEELAAAIAGRDHWQYADGVALYARPDTAEQVRVQPAAIPDKRSRFVASIVRDGRAVRARPCHDAREAVTWAERVPLD